MVSYLQDTNTLEVYDGSAWVGATGDITGLTAGTGISISSATGPVPTITSDVATTFDAKGDLVVGTGADTFAKLTVGNSGDTIVADSSATVGLRYSATPSASNPILNSSFDIWQRGTSIAGTGAVLYTADRWSTNATSSFTVSRQTTSDTTNLPNIQYCARFARNSGQTTTTAVSFIQSMESANSIPFAGKTVTMSFYARKGANFSMASDNLIVYLIGGTGTDQNYQTTYTGASFPINNQTATLTTTWQRFSYTGSVATTVTELTAYFQYQGVGTAGAADYFEITGVQIDVGSVALPYRRSSATLAGELAACQRYYYRINADSANSVFGVGMNAASTSANHMVNFPVSMRVAPTSLEYSTIQVSDFNNYGTDATTAAFGSVSTSKNTCILYISGITGLTANQPSFLRGKTQNTSYVAFSAEL